MTEVGAQPQTREVSEVAGRRLGVEQQPTAVGLEMEPSAEFLPELDRLAEELQASVVRPPVLPGMDRNRFGAALETRFDLGPEVSDVDRVSLPDHPEAQIARQVPKEIGVQTARLEAVVPGFGNAPQTLGHGQVVHAPEGLEEHDAHGASIPARA